MSVKDFLLRALVAGAIMGVLDAIWLMVVAKRFYRNRLGDLLLDKPNMAAAVVFYVVYVVGVVAFVLAPALDKESSLHAWGYGALLGVLAYCTYDLTNLATLKGFPVTVVVVDIVWGAVLTATVCGLSYTVLHSWLN